MESRKAVEDLLKDNKFQYENRYIIEYNKESRKPVVKSYDISR